MVVHSLLRRCSTRVCVSFGRVTNGPSPATPRPWTFRASPPAASPKAVAGARRTMSSSTAAQGQLHRGIKTGAEERKIWPYLKAAKQQFFNVMLASLGIAMATKMLEGKGARVALEEQIAELERREAVLTTALADEEWAETTAERMGAVGGRDVLLHELSKVLEKSALDEENAQLEAMRSAALKTKDSDSVETSQRRDGDHRAVAGPAPAGTKGMM